MFCFNCGNKVEDNSVFCEHCGTKLVDTPEGNICSVCGTQNDIKSEFCEECGNPLSVSKPVAEQEQPRIEKPQIERPYIERPKVERPKKEKPDGTKGKYILIAVEAVILVVLIAFFVYRGTAYSTSEKVVAKFYEAEQKGDWETIYDLCADADTQYVDKEVFVKMLDQVVEGGGSITEYLGQNTNNGYNKRVGTKLNYTEKHYLFFDKWEIDISHMLKKNCTIRRVYGATLNVDGVAVSEDSMAEIDGVEYYVIPRIFAGEHILTWTSEDGIIKDSENNLSVYEDDAYYYPEVKYEKEAAKAAVKEAKNITKAVYDAAYEDKGVDSVSKYFVSEELAEEFYEYCNNRFDSYRDSDNYTLLGYEAIVEKASTDSTTVYSYGIPVEVTCRIKLKYSYRSSSSDSVYTRENSSSSYLDLEMGYVDGEWKVI